MTFQAPVRQIIWPNLLFFAVTMTVTVIGLPWYVWKYGISPVEWVIFIFFVLATGLSITVGYHRYFAHKAFDAHPLIEFLVLLFGAAAFEMPVLDWASQHRDHHRYVDTEKDPYSIKKGFFYAHIGWMIFWKHHLNRSNIKDLLRNKMAVNQHRNYYAWALGAGVLLPLTLGFLTGHALGVFIFAICSRYVLVHHSTFCINSVCHTFGSATYDIDATAKDHWFVAILTNGEGYHNFHHRFPCDYRNGVRWYHWDPSKWSVALLSFVGLVSNLKRTPEEEIKQARLVAMQTRMSRLALNNSR